MHGCGCRRAAEGGTLGRAEVTLRRGSAGRGRRRRAPTAPTSPRPWPTRWTGSPGSGTPARSGSSCTGAVVHVAARLAKAGRWAAPPDRPRRPPLRRRAAWWSKRYVPLVPLILRDFGIAMRRAASVDVIVAGMAGRYRGGFTASNPRSSTVPCRGLIVASPSYDRDRVRGLRVGVLGTTYRTVRSSPSWTRRSRLTRRCGSARGGACSSSARGSATASAPTWPALSRSSPPGTSPRRRGSTSSRLPGGLPELSVRPTGRRAAADVVPDELSTYVRAARPLLVHAPADGSTVPLCRSHPSYASHWASRSPTTAPAAGAALGRPRRRGLVRRRRRVGPRRVLRSRREPPHAVRRAERPGGAPRGGEPPP